jgi:hypothetical protein
MEFEEKVKLLKKARAYWIWGLILTPLFPVGFGLRYLAVRLIAKVMDNDEISSSYGCGLLFCFIPFLSIPLVTGSLRDVGKGLKNNDLYGAAKSYSFSAWVLVGAGVLYLFGWSVYSEAILLWSMLIGFLGFASLLYSLVEEAKGVWYLHEISEKTLKTLKKASSSRVKGEYDWMAEPFQVLMMLIASPTGLFIIFLFIWILVMGVGDSKILQHWARVIGIVGICFGGLLTWGVAEREKELRERKKWEDYERRCRRWGEYWGMPGIVLLVLNRLKEKEGKEQWKKEEIIEAVIKTLKEGIKDYRELLDEYRSRVLSYDRRRDIDTIRQELDKLDKRDEIIPRIQDALNELVIEGLLNLYEEKGEIYTFRRPWEKFLSPFPTEEDLIEEGLRGGWEDLSGLW